jgi:glycosyltransferase involved in cell wall biosynthesis
MQNQAVTEPMPQHESIVYVLPDKMGGMMSILGNVLAHREPDEFNHHVILTHNRLSRDTRFAKELAADTQRTVEYQLPIENIHAVIRRLRRALPAGGGVMVTNDLLELALASSMDLGRTVMMILHGDHDYYYDLAERHADVVDVFICYGREMFDTLRRRLPDRERSIVHLPYGIPLPAQSRTSAAGPLRLLFSGRLEHGQKGILDLPDIDAALRESRTSVKWTIVGAGPDEAILRSRWGSQGSVGWLGARSNAEVLEIATQHDVFVLPTRAEGFPVALVEAMGTGLVPVVSDLASGIRELIEPGKEGFTPAVGDVRGFAEAIRVLDTDRARLESMSRAARDRITEKHDIRSRVRAYQELFARHAEFRRPRSTSARLPYGSRLDQPWIPNFAVKALRTVARRTGKKRCRFDPR